MITGVVTADRDAVLQLLVRGPTGNECFIDALIDTGFDGGLSLPPDGISSLRLTWRRRGRALVADGRESLFDIYEGELYWDGRWRRVTVDETEALPLIGTALLAGQELNIEFESGGAVTIQPLHNDSQRI